MANPPVAHHYIPQFLLREWQNDQGKLCRFTRPFSSKIDVKWVSPKQVGFENNLYSITGAPAETAQIVEQGFMQAVDDAAADALAILTGKLDWRWDERTRSGWARFISSIWYRTPENLAAFKRAAVGIWRASDANIQARYEQIRKPGDPPLFEDRVLRDDENALEKIALRLFTHSIDDAERGAFISNMSWNVLTLDGSGHDFLISDNPVIASNGIARRGGHIAIPIGPKKLFLATGTHDTHVDICSKPSALIASMVNVLVVERASHFVAGTDDRQRRFVENRFGRSPEISIVQRMAQKYEP